MVAIDKGTDIFGVVFLEVITALGGGMIRDVLIQETPFVIKKRVYAVAAIIGALLYTMMMQNGADSVFSYAVGWGMTTMLRLVATWFKWNLPRAL